MDIVLELDIILVIISYVVGIGSMTAGVALIRSHHIRHFHINGILNDECLAEDILWIIMIAFGLSILLFGSVIITVST